MALRQIPPSEDGEEVLDNDGAKVFNAMMEEKISKMQLQQMENRLKKLEDEDKRANMLIE